MITWFLAKIPAKALFIGVAVLICTNFASLTALKFAYERVGKLENAVESAQAANAEWEQLNSQINQKYTSLVNQRAADRNAAELAAEQAIAERDRLASQLESSRNERDIIYATNPDADQWGRTRVPADIANSLR